MLAWFRPEEICINRRLDETLLFFMLLTYVEVILMR